MIKIYDRKNDKMETEKQFGSKELDFLYNHTIGRLMLKPIINPLFSHIYGIYCKSRLSKNKIKTLIADYKIDVDKYVNQQYNSFNDFFTRELKSKEIIADKYDLISPAESKLSVFKISENLKVRIKKSDYSLKELLGEQPDASFKSGYCLVFRLSMDNYHRYCFIENGEYISQKYIGGKLHTVSSISDDYKIYKENKRVINKLSTDFGIIYQIEVGALSVGKIENKSINKLAQSQILWDLGFRT